MLAKKKGSYSFDDTPSESTGNETEMPESPAEDAQDTGPEQPDESEEDAGDQSPGDDTATISSSILGGKQVNPGDVIRLEVVSASADDGTVTVKSVSEKAPNEFDKPMKGVM